MNLLFGFVFVFGVLIVGGGVGVFVVVCVEMIKMLEFVVVMYLLIGFVVVCIVYVVVLELEVFGFVL